jgi:Mrp family chromosome partitioning ATPase
VVVVTRAGKTSGKAVAIALKALLRARANIMGLVMTQVKRSTMAYGYGYGYGKGYGDRARAVTGTPANELVEVNRL